MAAPRVGEQLEVQDPLEGPEQDSGQVALLPSLLPRRGVCRQELGAPARVGWGFTKATRLNLAVGKMQMWRGLPMDGCVVEPKMAGRHEHVSRMASSL